MKILYTFFSVICLSFVLLGCNESKSETSVSTENNSPTDITTSKGCEICLLQTILSDLEKKEIEFGVRKLNDCETKLFSKVKSDKDSLGKIVEELFTQYKLDYNTAISKCAELYPIKITDENLRDSLLYEIEHWNFYSKTLHITPEFDTTCGNNAYYENGRYGLKVRGELVWVSEEKYPELVNKYYTTKTKIDQLIYDRKKALVIKLTGIEDPDEYCMEIISRQTNSAVKKLYKKYNTMYKIIDDPELDELLKLISKID